MEQTIVTGEGFLEVMMTAAKCVRAPYGFCVTSVILVDLEKYLTEALYS